jgi:hypothetical protein
MPALEEMYSYDDKPIELEIHESETVAVFIERLKK